MTEPADTQPHTWLPDPSHYPEQMTPLSAATWFAAVGHGLHQAMRELRGPFGGFLARTERGWAYEGELAPGWEVDGSRLQAAAVELGERWEADLCPRAHAITAEIESMRPEDPPPEGGQQMLDRLGTLLREQWTIHFLVVIPAQVATEILHDRYIELLGADDPLAPYRLVEGLPNESVEADAALWRLARLAGELGVADDLLSFPEASVRERLALRAAGRRWLHHLDGYLLRFGGRSRWHELSLPREAERPQLTIESVRMFLETGESPRLHAAARDALEADALARAPGLRPILEAAKRAYPLKESHAYHLDYPGLLATREALLGFGRRLFAEDVIDDVDDVWMLTRAELREALAGSGDDVRAIVDERRADLAAGRAEGVRPFLGRQPSDGERHAALEKFYGTQSAVSGGAVRGTAASPGVGEGTARIVSHPDDFARVRAGDVLIAATTTPAWTPLFPSLAALVTDTGGILSHAAVIAREYGIPAVVGAVSATAVIPDGSRVRVDGDTGLVTLVGP